MMKILMIPVLAIGLVFVTPETSHARERGLSTFSGQRSALDYGSAVGFRAAGERCKVTMCGRSTSTGVRVAPGAVQSDEDIVGRRSAVRARLGAPSCNSTFCGKR